MWKTSLTLVFYKFGNFSKRFCEFFLTNKILYKFFLYKLEKLHVLWRYFLSKLSAFHKTYPIGFGIGIGRYQKKLSVSVSVLAEKKIENIGDYWYRPKWKKAFRSYPNLHTNFFYFCSDSWLDCPHEGIFYSDPLLPPNTWIRMQELTAKKLIFPLESRYSVIQLETWDLKTE